MAVAPSVEAALDKAFSLLTGNPQQQEQAVVLLDRAMGRRLENYFIRHKVQENDAEELVWDTWLKLLKSEFRGETRPEIWIWTIARSLLISYHRRDRPEIGLDDEDWTALLATMPAHRMAEWIKLCVERALWQFEHDHPERAEILRMLAEEWSAEEVGEFLGCKPGAARDRVYRTRERVKEYLEECKESE